MTIDYLKPVDVESEIIVEALRKRKAAATLFQVGEIRNTAGEVLARGKARFVIIGQTEKKNS